jgi:hypothetical protein
MVAQARGIGSATPARANDHSSVLGRGEKRLVRDLGLALIGEAVEAGAQGGDIDWAARLRPGLGEEEFSEPVDGHHMPEASSRDLDLERGGEEAQRRRHR